MLDVESIKKCLNLKEHPREGGFFVETYRSRESFPPGVLPETYSGQRSFSTSIYYLLTPESFSAMHRLPGDELFHFYLGDPVEMLQLHKDGSGHLLTLGTDLLEGMRPQALVPAGTWQGSRLAGEGQFALLGATMAPGFDYDDYEAGSQPELVRLCPDFARHIKGLTR